MCLAAAAVLTCAAVVRAGYTPVYGTPGPAQVSAGQTYYYANSLSILGTSFFARPFFGVQYQPELLYTPVVADGVAFGNLSPYVNGTSQGEKLVRITPAGNTVIGSAPLVGGGNAAGAVAGSASFTIDGAAVSSAARWDPGATAPTRLDGAGGQVVSGSLAYAINAGGTAVGTAGGAVVR